MNLGVEHPAVLWFLALAALPLFAGIFRRQGLPSLLPVPGDVLSAMVVAALRSLGVVAIAGTVLGLSGLHRREHSVPREGFGTHLVLLLDRSASMNDTFAGRVPGRARETEEESKSAAAKRLLTEFVAGRPHDRIAVAAFSTSPLLVLPMTDRIEAVEAAIAAIDRPGLAYTDVGRGLALAMSLFDDATLGTSRALLLVSDGAAVIDHRVQDALRDLIRRLPVHLYWLYLRSAGSPGILEPSGGQSERTPQADPERHLHVFLASLGVPYRAFEATSPGAVKDAVAEIDRLETRPLRYLEQVPRRDVSRHAYGVAGAATGLLLLAKLLERDLASRSDPIARQGSRSRRPSPA